MIPQNNQHAFGREFLGQIAGWINEEMNPEDVFDFERLQDWAERNGYIRTDHLLDRLEAIVRQHKVN